MNKKFTAITLMTCFGSLAFAQQNPDILNWYNGGKGGMQTEKAYKKLKKRTSTEVIVAVVDSGVDIEHEDLKGQIWVNAYEIPGNGIDDDKNGYIDDIHGWNFLGNASGEHLSDATLEKTRILRDLSKKFDGIDATKLSAKDKKEYELFQEVKAAVEGDRAQYSQYISYMDMMPNIIAMIPGQIAEKLGKEDYTEKDLKKWKAEGQDAQLKTTALAILRGDLTIEAINAQKEQISGMLEYNLNPEFNDRGIVGDDPNDFTQVKYGNNDVEGPDALHGTHVGGIIGAVRGNKLGGDGVAENVKLMVLRAVPNGDEYDKDIALSIRYAVDNGASVINMSFGKAYSPNAKEVYEAFKYADDNGVLLVHAAGNDGANLDEAKNFPKAQYDFQAQPFDHWLEIGASTRVRKKKLAASFSNYSSSKVDIFAPGFEIYNTVPQSEYKKLQGTSMAAPMVSGVAAMLKSYFPILTMLQIKNIIMETGKSYVGTMQVKPGTEEEVDFATLSKSGKIVDVKAAVKACLALEKLVQQ
jgi:cell wall-associated protease